MAVKFQPRPGKPHIAIIKNDSDFYLWIKNYFEFRFADIKSTVTYCIDVNPSRGYETPGEAARALHYGRKYI